MTALVFCALTSVGWGLAALADRQAALRAPVVVTLMYGEAAGLALIPALAVVSSADVFRLPAPELMLWAAASNVVVFCAWACYLKALQFGETSVTVGLVSAYPLVTLALLAGFFAQAVSLVGAVGVVLLISALVTVQATTGKRDAGFQPVALGWIGASVLAWGAFAICDWRALHYGSPVQVLALYQFVGLVPAGIACLVLRATGTTLHFPRAATNALIARTALYGVADLTFLFALQRGKPGYVVALTATYPLVTLAVLVAFRRETWSARRALGLVLIAAGVGAVQSGML